MGGVFIARRLTDKIWDDPQNPCPKKWDKPELQVVTLSPEFGATHSRTKFDPFSHFCPGTPGHPFWVTFWVDF